jgi:hypothetical protein
VSVGTNPNNAGSQSFVTGGPAGRQTASIYSSTFMLADKPPTLDPTVEIGVSGVPVYAGRVYDEWDPRLQGDLAIRVYREMQTYSVIAGFLFGIDQLIRRVEWTVEPAEDGGDPEAAEITFVDSCLHDMSFTWADTLSQNFSMVPYGWSFSEITYKRRKGYDPGIDPETGKQLPVSRSKDGRYGLRKIALRTQETRWRWEIDVEGGIQGMWQSAPPDYIPRFIPIERALLFRTSLVRPSPESVSCLRGAYQSWYYAKRFARIEAIGVERDLAGLPTIGVPPELLRSDATADQVSLREALKDLVTSVRRDEKEGFLFPLEYDDDHNLRYEFKLLGSPGTRQLDIDAIIARYDQRMSMAVLADFILLGHEQTGSYALGESKTSFFTAALQTWLTTAASVYNNHMIPRLMAINGIDPALSPKLVPGKVTETDFGPLGEFILKVSQAGAELFPNETLTRALLQRAELPDDGLPDDPMADPRATPLLDPSKPPAPSVPGGNGKTGDRNEAVTG